MLENVTYNQAKATIGLWNLLKKLTRDKMILRFRMSPALRSENALYKLEKHDGGF